MNDWTRRILGIGLLSLFVLGAACTAAPAANTGGDGGSGGIGGGGGGTGGTGTGGTGTGGTGGTGTGGTGGTGTGGTGGTGTGGTGGTGTGGTGGTGTGGTGGTVVQDGLMVYGFNAEAIPRGATYADITANGIPPFSYSRHSLTLKNEGTELVTVLGFTVTPLGATLPTEWRVVEPDVSAPTEITTIEVALAPTESYDFDLYFYPFESGPRSATIEISLGSGGSYSFQTDGRGRDDALFSPDVEASHEGIYGSPGGDVLVGGLAMDPAGNTYMNLNANEWLDGFSEDIVLTRINADGTLAWAMEWNEDYEQLSPDPGQNGESGGSADSISYSDGAVYVVGHRSQSSFNSTFQTLVMKVDAATGALLWARGWVPAGTEIPDIASESSEGYAIDATLADRVIVAGAANGMVTVIALAKADGALLYDRQIDVAVGSNDRAHALAVHTDGSGYVGGLTNGRGLLVRLTGLGGNDPAISWSQELSMGIGSNVNSLAIDAASGDVFASLDRRGATTFFSAARISAAGATVWSKTWDAQNNGDNNNTYVVRTDGTRVVVGGRIAFTPFDTQYAEGFLLAVNAADGAYDFSTFYYTGKGAEEMVEHRVKGVAFDGTKLRVATQSYTNGLDFDHYWGFWYQAPDYTLELPPGDGSERYVDYTLQTTDKTPTSTITTPAASSAFLIDASTFWVAPPPSAVYSPARTREGPGGDGTLLYQIVDLK